jgi:hypothetical protein
MTDQTSLISPILETALATTPIPAAQSEAVAPEAAIEATAPARDTCAETGPLTLPTCSCGSGRGSRVARLAAAAEEAAQVRALTLRPDVVALRVDRVRAQVDALLWAGIALGLVFTTVNVQQFAAADAAVFTTQWWVAWLLDPVVSLVLLAVLRAEQVTARYKIALGAWPRRAKWCAFGATYLMITWTSWGLNGDTLSVSGVVLHSVPPLVVVLSAETGPVLRHRLTDAAQRALTNRCGGHEDSTQVRASDVTRAIVDNTTATGGVVHPVASLAVHGETSQDVHGDVSRPVREPGSGCGERSVREPAVREPVNQARPGSSSATGQRQTSRKHGQHPGGPRRLLADYLAEAHAALADAAATGKRPDPTPAWCRQATGCSAGTSVKLAAALRRTTGQPAGTPAADQRSETKPDDTPLSCDQAGVDHVDPDVRGTERAPPWRVRAS